MTAHRIYLMAYQTLLCLFCKISKDFIKSYYYYHYQVPVKDIFHVFHNKNSYKHIHHIDMKNSCYQTDVCSESRTLV